MRFIIMKTQESQEPSTLLARRAVLKTGAIGAAAIRLATFAPLALAQRNEMKGETAGTQDRKNGDGMNPRTRDAREWGTNLAQYGTFSLMGSEMALTKAVNAGVKEFATCEATE